MSTMHLDAVQSAFFLRELEHINAQAFLQKLPQLKARQFVPIQPGVNPGARSYTFRQFTQYGQAKAIRDHASDLPRADISGAEFTVNISDYGMSYGYTVMEVKAAAMAQRPLDAMRAAACRRAIETKIDDVLALGDSARGIAGVLTLADAASYTLKTKAAGGKTWGTVGAPHATADEMIEDVMGLVSARVEATDENFSRFLVVLPLEQYNLLAFTKLGAGDGTLTAKQFIMANCPYVADIQPWTKCRDANTTSTSGTGSHHTRMACFPQDLEVIQGLVPQEFEPQAPEQRNLAFVVAALATCGGVVSPYPVAVGYADGL